MKKRLLGFLFAICSFALTVNAQEYLPFISSPYAGQTAGKLNPASIAGTKYKFDITVFGASSGVHNDLLIFPRKDIIFNGDFYKDLWKYKSDLFDLNVPAAARTKFKDYLKKTTTEWDKDSYGGYFNGQFDVLNLMYSFNDRFAMAIGYGKRWQASGNGLPKEIASELFRRYDMDGASSYNTVDFADPTNVAVSIYDQVALSAGYTLLQKDNYNLKVGATAKLLFNGRSAFGYAKGYHGTIGAGATKRLDRIGEGEAGISKEGKVGIGVDVGVEYEYLPAELAGDEIANYRIKAGVSVLDLGGFSSKGARHEKLKAGGGIGIPNGVEDLLRRYGTGTSAGEYSIGLPTVVTASVDYRFGASPMFLNFTPYIALGQSSVAKVAKFNSYNLIPHAEWKNFGVSIPLQYDQYGQFTAGLGVRAWRHVWIGSNTILKNIVSKNNYSADAHIMVKIPIGESADRDGDGVPDKKDRCPDVPGLKKFQGCPDTDGDGIPDDQDACPNEPGPAATNGCPDRDGDGVPDKDDRCPDQAGPKELQGCPDRDGDGVPDIDDECPDQAGPKATKGCPDRDGDGVADKDDRCPDQAGPAALKGCPDRDGDGVPDIDDECPDVPGPASNKGCPISDKIKNVEFDIDKYNIKPIYHAELDKVVELLTKNPNATVTIVGHTDITYTHAYNMQLSKRRAESVKNYFVKKNIDAKRINTEYYGPDKPIADNKTVDGRARNRRSEMTIVVK